MRTMSRIAANKRVLRSYSAKPAEVVAMLDALEPIRAIAPDPEIVNRAVAVHAKYGLHFYDGMIIACAERAGSKRVWSEHLNDGHAYFGIRVQNPFVQASGGSAD